MHKPLNPIIMIFALIYVIALTLILTSFASWVVHARLP